MLPTMEPAMAPVWDFEVGEVCGEDKVGRLGVGVGVAGEGVVVDSG